LWVIFEGSFGKCPSLFECKVKQEASSRKVSGLRPVWGGTKEGYSGENGKLHGRPEFLGTQERIKETSLHWGKHIDISDLKRLTNSRE